MKKLFAWITFVGLGTAASFAATSPIYINNAPLIGIPPQIDAKAFLNRSSFDVSSTFPFQAQHVLFWTNNGVMNGNPGFLFQHDSGGLQSTGKKGKKPRANSRNLRISSSVFLNDGTISVGSLLSSTIFGLASPTPLLSINASNVFNQGRLNGGETANITILATNGSADLSRSGIRVGPDSTGFLLTCDTTPFGSNYFLDTKVSELYWGAGQNNDLGTNGAPLNLPLLASTFGSNLRLPQPFTPIHQVVSRLSGVTGSRSLFTNLVRLPGFSIFGGGCSGNYDAYVYTNFLNATGMTVNVVFVPTNSLIALSNLSIDVRFDTFNAGTFGAVPASVIEFRSVDFDIVEQRLSTNYVTLVDTTGSQTNVFLARPFATASSGGSGSSLAPATRRPSTYNFFTSRYCNIDFLQPANTLYDQGIFYNANFETNTASTIYAAYSAQIGQSNSAALGGSTIITAGGLRQLGADPGLSDPTNFSGRVDISAGKLDINGARLRAENFISIKARDLVGNSLATIDAPFINLDVTSSQPNLVISNISPPSVSRLLGRIAAWSSAWSANVTNVTAGGTNLHSIRYQVTLVDNCLQSQQPVTLHRFVAKSTNVVIQDNLFVNASFDIQASALTVGPQGSLSLPLGTTLAFTNVQHLLNFTNLGSINTPGAAYFGTYDAGHTGTTPPRRKKPRKKALPPPTPLDNFVNEGVLTAASLFVRATNVENSGTSLLPATLVANGGVVSVEGLNSSVTDSRITATSDVEIRGNHLSLENTLISAGSASNALNQYVRGSLVLAATNSLGDFGSASSNLWLVTAGVKIPSRPASVGDLLGTHIYSTAGTFVQSPIVWAGEDRGPVLAGFTNNLALGRLTLDGSFGTLFRFQSATANNAIYVDYLDLLNGATNYNFILGVDPGFTIYFADSSVPPEKLDSLGGGRIRWVSQFIGANSGTNITYPNNVTYRFNGGVVRSKDLDSDGDGIVNADDCTPVIPPGEESNPALWFGANCAAPALAAAKTLSTENIALTITLAPDGQKVVLNWNAAANSANTVEFTDSIEGGTWRPLTNFINGPGEARVTVKDAVNAPLRVYRVRVDAGNP